MEVYFFNVLVSKLKFYEYFWCEVRFDYSIIYKYIYDC